MEEIIVSNNIIENNEKNQNTTSNIEKNDQNDQDSLQSRDSIEREINEQDQIKNSEESNYEDIEESNSPFLLRQIQKSKNYLDKKDNSSKNSKDEEYEDEEDYDDDNDEFLDDDNDNNCDDKEKIEISEKVTEESIAKDSALSNKENEIDLKANKIEEPFKQETIPQKLNLSRQTSQNSNNSVTTSVNPALTPSKKGGFYEHDNRDEEEKKNDSDQSKEPSRKSSLESKNTGFPNIKPHKIEKSTSGSNEDVNSERWSHDLYENHEKSEKKPNQFKIIKHSNNYTDKKKIKENKNLEISNYDKDSNKPNLSNTPSLKTQNLKIKKQLKISTISDQNFESKADEVNKSNNKELIKQELEFSNKSKGLSLSEYLEQKGEVTEEKNEKVELKPKRRPNIQPYQPHQRFLNNDVAKNNHNYKDKRNLIVEKEDLNTNITSDLKKRLDFSTRKPINKSNFDENLELDNDFDKNTSRRYNLKITTNMDSSTRTVQEEQIQNEISATSYNQNNKNNSKKYQIRNNDSQNFIRSTYDEYYVPAEDTFEKNGYFKPKKYFNYDRNKQENKLEYDDNKNELNNRYIKNDQQFGRNKSTIVQNEQSITSHNHNDYSEYATYNNDLNQQHSNNNNNFQVKSQSYTNSNNRIRNQHINNNFAERVIKSQQELGFQRNQLDQTQPPFQNNFRKNNINSQQLTNQQNFQNNNSNYSFPNDSNLRTNQFQQQNF